jgi:trans-aconitate methyltransferase
MLKKLMLVLFLNAGLISSEPYEFSQEQIEAYHIGSDVEPHDLEPLISGDFFQGAKTVLDIGCGDGKITALFAKQFPDLTFIGCDISKNMIDFASKKYPASEYPNLSFIVKDACDLSYDAEIDRIISYSTLHWVKDQKVALTSIYDALKPGGRAFIRTTPKTSNNEYKTICMKVIMSFKWMTHFMGYKSDHSFHSERDYKKILTSVGFKVEKIEQKSHETTISNRANLNNFLKGVLTLLTHLPENKRGAFLDDYYEELVNNGNVDEEGAIRIRSDRVDLALVKP